MFRRKKRPDSADAVDSPGAGLRAKALDLRAQDIGLAPGDGDVWGVILDTSFTDGGWYSLVVEDM